MSLRSVMPAAARGLAVLVVLAVSVTGLGSPARAAVAPGASVTITSPAADESVGGTLAVAVSASTDPAQADDPWYVELFQDGVLLDTEFCGVRPVAEVCDVGFTWDTTGLSGSHTLLARLTTEAGDTALSGAVTVSVTSPGPTAVVTSPAAGTTVQGTVTVAATGSTDPSQTDEPWYVELFDGGVQIDTEYCGAVRPVTEVCDVTYAWDTTGLTGTHTLLARVTTVTGRTAVSAPVTITVVSPSPAVVITTPAAGAVVRGTATIAVTGSTDPSQTDEPSYVEVFADGSLLDTQFCGDVRPVTEVCDVTYGWDTTGLAGRHTLSARVSTLNGRTATTSRTVTVFSGTRTSVTVAPAVKPGTRVTVRGRVTTTADGRGLAGATVRVRLSPAVGAARTVTVRTSSTGSWSTTATVRTSTTVVASVVATAAYGASSRTATQRVKAPLRSRFSASTTRPGRTLRGTASATYLPAGTTVAMQYRDSAGWHTFARFRAPGSSFTFWVKFNGRGTYLLRLVTASNRVYTTTNGPAMKVVVR